LPALITARARRLLLPALLLGPLIILAKCALAPFLTIDNVPRSISTGLINLLWHPNHSPAYDLWFLIVLFALSIIAPILRLATQDRLWPIILLASLLYILPLPSHLYLALTGHYAIFYVLGLAAGRAGPAWSAWIDRHAKPCLALLAMGGLVVATTPLPFAVTLLPMGVISMPALNGLVRFPGLNSALWLAKLGRWSMAIYLLNTLCIGLAKAGLLALTSWNGWHFFAIAPALLAVGLIGPILIKRRFLPAIPALDRVVEERRHHLPHPGPEPLHGSRRERPVGQPAEARVVGRVRGEHRPGVPLGEEGDPAAASFGARTVAVSGVTGQPGVAHCRLYVGVAGQHPEPLRILVEHRRLLELPVPRVRIDDERVIGGIERLRRASVLPLRTDRWRCRWRRWRQEMGCGETGFRVVTAGPGSFLRSSCHRAPRH